MMLQDGWRTDPWVMECVDEYVYGCGVTDDKGPIVATLYVVMELQVD
jgi:acetylornithine deacetylase/succinyl-diaminopimelate desuccinylase-like protein